MVKQSQLQIQMAWDGNLKSDNRQECLFEVYLIAPLLKDGFGEFSRPFRIKMPSKLLGFIWVSVQSNEIKLNLDPISESFTLGLYKSKPFG